MRADEAVHDGAAARLRRRVVNVLRLDAQRHGLRLASAEEALDYGQALSDAALLGVHHLGPKALAWLRAQSPAGGADAGEPADPIAWWPGGQGAAGERNDPAGGLAAGDRAVPAAAPRAAPAPGPDVGALAG